MRIYKDRYYVMQDWRFTDHYISTGHKAQSDRTRVLSEYTPTGTGTFRLHDGHCPESQPVADEREALAWLDIERFQRITQIAG